jgi:hypothetical protein
MSAPPPWHLVGDGFIWLFHFAPDFVERNGGLTDWQRASLKNRLGAVMLVDYRETNIGPYRELLFIPGQFQPGGWRSFSISKIYVSTEASVRYGIENWGIPKELAVFVRDRRNGSAQVFSVMRDGWTIFSSQLAPFGPRFPISSSLVPLTVAQERRGDLLITRSTARGWARLCRVRDLRVDARHFPDVTRVRPMLVLAVSDFRMTFPAPQVIKGYFAQSREALADSFQRLTASGVGGADSG